MLFLLLGAGLVDEGSDTPEGAIVNFSPGSGFIISPEGHVLTNVHVEAREIAWVVIDDEPRRLDLVALETDLDLALYRLEGADDVEWIPIRAKPPVRYEPITCIGYLDKDLSISQGRMRSRPEMLGGIPIIEHNAPTLWGSSGSPLLDTHGEAIGVHWARSETRRTLLAIDLPAAVALWEPLAEVVPPS